MKDWWELRAIADNDIFKLYFTLRPIGGRLRGGVFGCVGFRRNVTSRVLSDTFNGSELGLMNRSEIHEMKTKIKINAIKYNK